MNSSIQPHTTWDVQDSSKLQEYLQCPRRYFFHYVLGWKWDTPNIHLEFGSAIHLAMEHLLTNGYGAESLAQAYMLFYEYYRDHFGAEDDAANAPKTPDNAYRALQQYCEFYKNRDKFKVLYTEVAGRVEVAEGKSMVFKIDSIVSNPDIGIHCLEHKTASSLGRLFTDQWRNKIQTGMYSHVLYCLYDPKEVFGVVINGIKVTNPPKLKLNGEPYAGATDNEFLRVPVQFTPLQMQAWHTHLLTHLTHLEEDFCKLEDASENDDIMDAFATNGESCTSYSGCPYAMVCSAWVNPLQHLDQIPAGMKVDFWNPLEEVKKAKRCLTIIKGRSSFDRA